MPESRGPAKLLVSVLVAAALAGCGLGGSGTRDRGTGDPSIDPPIATRTTPGRGSSPSPVYPEPSVSSSPLPALAGRTGTPAASLPAAPKVDGRDAIAVAKAAVVTMWTVDTDLDATLWDAAQRAAPFLTPEYAESLRMSPKVAGPGGEWLAWSRHKAVTSVDATSADDSGKPPDTETMGLHAFSLRITPTGRDGWRGPTTETTVFVALVRASAAQPWKVESVTAVE